MKVDVEVEDGEEDTLDAEEKKHQGKHLGQSKISSLVSTLGVLLIFQFVCVKKLRLCHKLHYSNSYIFANQRFTSRKFKFMVLFPLFI